jgi:4a-hydroxytetrahydrobiopterin dehydratase
LLGWFDMTQLLSEQEIQEQAANLTGWIVSGSQLECTRKFRDFVEAIEFVNKLVDPAETAGHHPDIEISYNRVKISLTTHDAHGLTQKDFDLAKVISQIQ